MIIQEKLTFFKFPGMSFDHWKTVFSSRIMIFDHSKKVDNFFHYLERFLITGKELTFLFFVLMIHDNSRKFNYILKFPVMSFDHWKTVDIFLLF